jgi:hypothetical protein
MADSSDYLHVILTRFNCSNSRLKNDREIPIRSQPGWLEQRFELFERYCLPSVHGQSDRNFRWHIYFDAETPVEFLDRAKRDLGGHENFALILCDLYGSETVTEDLTREFAGKYSWLVTTRFDNDDGLSRYFVERLHDSVRVGVREALNFPLGIVFQNGRSYLSRQRSNAFLSFSEPFREIDTVLRTAHNQFSSVAPIRDIDSEAAWVQVLHGGNVSNKLRGRRIPQRNIPAGFETIPALAHLSTNDRPWEIAIENATIGVSRSIRDLALHTYRQTRRLTRGV